MRQSESSLLPVYSGRAGGTLQKIRENRRGGSNEEATRAARAHVDVTVHEHVVLCVCLEVGLSRYSLHSPPRSSTVHHGDATSRLPDFGAIMLRYDV